MREADAWIEKAVKASDALPEEASTAALIAIAFLLRELVNVARRH